ncbi:hypothetical protein ILYODFUR_014204 [Ilyodon furcidens]|uniref:Uncharacterized protein n=1 Tax=Ilyodon furcidens TaxID=33524 RepID=A0ABV0TKE2_9TELE
MEFTCGGVPLWGRGIVAFGFGGMCSISVSLLRVALWEGSCWGSLGVRDSWGWDRSSLGGRDCSVLGGSGWRAGLSDVDPSFVYSPLSGGGWGLLGTGLGTGVTRVWAVLALSAFPP